jgi:hypothetical protein
MGLRFTQRIRPFKGLTLNLSKSSTSWTVGGPGASVNIRGRKVTGTVGVPGTGLSYRHRGFVPSGALPWWQPGSSTSELDNSSGRATQRAGFGLYVQR